ncbi:DNA/RNA non-specific endonuclease [Stieleria sp. TO1_6]|uniref:DNA/RNA non-specific endonuclease n=1 Tax=Stieleria tagensis TaxID=2956795 RepID=UPI00209A9AEB|nr:DNA/RNA non-specific endonuclease [Stieleria tagensis]MCO8123925.1 DNA/RNA non-specific endonuclease [Stieleria tagensis]
MPNKNTSNQSQLESLFADKEVMKEIREKYSANEIPSMSRETIDLRETLGSRSAQVQETGLQEAIVLAFGRPSLFIQNNSFATPESTTWKQRLKSTKSQLESVIPKVGRVELFHHPDFEWVGTAWVIDEDVLVTNRHVADVFANKSSSGVISFRTNPFGQQIAAAVDFREEHQVVAEQTVEIEKVLFISDFGSTSPDVAFLKVKTGRELPDPIPLSATSVANGTIVSVIGYPAWDGRRNGMEEMRRIFGDVFNVKRLAPGFITSSNGLRLTHDCSTLGGNSGSPIIDADTGHAVGLHFAGRFLSANHGVDVLEVKRLLRSMNGTSSVLLSGGDGAEIDEARTVDFYEGRDGYRENFFGTSAELFVPLPQLSGTQMVDAARIEGRSRENAYVLDYEHFSSVMNGKRKIPFFTAVNIDGSSLVRPRRRRTTWQIDPRIDRDQQAGNELYRHNRLDRGHLVRRLDPVWGETDEAELAEEDTFHYTNAAPQHALLNQRDWLNLEDYLLDSLGEHDLKASVFTGPVFQESDRQYRDVQIPEAFWKVVVLLSQQNTISVTAYLLGQAAFLTDIEFTFGEFKTFQTSVSKISEMTELDFGLLQDLDPRSTSEAFGEMVLMTNPAAALGI